MNKWITYIRRWMNEWMNELMNENNEGINGAILYKKL